MTHFRWSSIPIFIFIMLANICLASDVPLYQLKSVKTPQDVNALNETLFDITQSKIEFHDRGDSSSNDFVLADLTTDGTWRDLDLTSVVPLGTKAVILEVGIQDDVANSVIQFRKNGNTNASNTQLVRTQAANIFMEGHIIVACTDGIIEYWATNTTFGSAYVNVTGWLK